MKDYSEYKVEDFLTDNEFIAWVKYPTDQTDQFWKQVMTDAVLRGKIQLAAATLKTLQFKVAKVPPDFYSSLKEKIDASIAQSQKTSLANRILRLNFLLKVAAIFILVIGGAFLIYQAGQKPKTLLVSTAYKEVKTFELPDHSTVTLNANSSVEYPENWTNNNRNVILKGEGFFKVRHIDNKSGAAKFTVHAGQMDVDVLGTEFNIKSRDENTSVMLQSGRVQLKVDGISDHHFLNPNDFVLYNGTTRQITRSVVNPSYHTAWINHKYNFTKVTLKEICNHLEDYYGFRFSIKDSTLVNQEISGTLLLDDEQSLLQTLSSLLNAKIEKQEKQITISSKQ